MAPEPRAVAALLVQTPPDGASSAQYHRSGLVSLPGNVGMGREWCVVLSPLRAAVLLLHAELGTVPLARWAHLTDQYCEHAAKSREQNSVMASSLKLRL